MKIHAETHATPSSCDQHTSSPAPPAVVPSSDHAKRTKYVCGKCGITFGRWDNLQHHVMYVCSVSSSTSSSGSGSSGSGGSGHNRRGKGIATYACKKCGRNFNTRDHMTRHARTACTDDVKEPPLRKQDEDTTVVLTHHRRRFHRTTRSTSLPLLEPSLTLFRRNC